MNFKSVHVVKKNSKKRNFSSILQLYVETAKFKVRLTKLHSQVNSLFPYLFPSFQWNNANRFLTFLLSRSQFCIDIVKRNCIVVSSGQQG